MKMFLACFAVAATVHALHWAFYAVFPAFFAPTNPALWIMFLKKLQMGKQFDPAFMLYPSGVYVLIFTLMGYAFCFYDTYEEVGKKLFKLMALIFGLSHITPLYTPFIHDWIVDALL